MLEAKLKSARKAAGLSLRGLQERIGNAVTAQAIGRYERGEMRPTPDVLKRIAEALGVSENHLVSEGGIRLGKIEFRENFIRSKKEEAQVEAKVLRHLGRYLELEDLLQIGTTEWDQPRDYPYVVKDLKDVELAAHKLRDDWKLGNDPIPNFSEFLEDRGIKTIYFILPASVAGVTCFVNREGLRKVPVIVINEDITGERQRFTLAHELGHLVLDNQSKIENENICNYFAGAFLMPDRILWATLGKHRSSISVGELISLKTFFGVSIQAIVFRCKNLGIISNSMYSDLFRVFARRGWLKPPYDEPERIQAEPSRRYQRLCYRALTEKVISEYKAAEFLDITPKDLEKEMNL
jgi:Zn-dependent peptidase ImmA (M78 family)